MCGFVGFIDPQMSPDELRLTITAMRDEMVHRGPDDAGLYLDESVGLAIGFRRLSILDLSHDGHQPMHSADKRYVLAFNGEIYNHNELRDELQQAGVVFRGRSDTEVLLAGIERWGFEQSLQRATGMFALALWDRRERRLLLARDRLGEKPLYYGANNGVLFFGSELKSFLPHPKWSAEINRRALKLFCHYKYIPSPYSIYERIYKLPPAARISLREERDVENRPTAYWSLADAASKGIRQRDNFPVGEAVERFEQLLTRTVKRQMLADVPLGAFLSGGVDSSTVVSIMQANSARPVKTFTIGFEESGYDEAAHARRIAGILGTDHHELYVRVEQARELIARLPHVWDEPFSDSSQLPTLILAELARQQVTVALSGDGGDELFGGYRRYHKARRLEDKRSRLPQILRTLIRAGLKTASSAGGLLDEVLVFRLNLAEQLLSARGAEELYLSLLGDWNGYYGPSVVKDEEALTGFPQRFKLPATATFNDWMQVFDSSYYLPDDIMVKVDRATMAVGLESRAPFLDHQLVEFAWTMPSELKSDAEGQKRLLLKILRRYIPEETFERPKQGFSLPIAEWLSGSLRDWAEALLSPKRLAEQGLFDVTAVRRDWTTHLAGKRSTSSRLWSILMFQAWLEAQERNTSVRYTPRAA